MDYLLGGFLFIFFIGYLAYTYINLNEGNQTQEDETVDPTNPKEISLLILKLVFGFILLFFGGDFLVDSGKNICQAFGISEYVISVIFVAFGTSFPELITSIVACMKNKDKEAFLKSITGTKPIQKKNNIKNSILINENLNTKNIKTKKIIIKNLVEPKIITTETKKNSKNKIEITKINKKLKKGKIPPDKKIDFHGMSLIEAEELLCNTVTTCYNTNKRCILFVTGKGVNKKEENYRM